MSEEFEKWFKRQLDSEYCSQNIKSLMLECWQASRQSLVVKLPEGDGDECGWVVSLVDVEDALDAAGVKYE
jgi:hypothetical protein